MLLITYHSFNRDRLLLILRIYKKIYIFLRFQVSGNKIEGMNRSRGEAGETIHHLFMAKLKGYITEKSASFIS